jgi:hypothetical protein
MLVYSPVVNEVTIAELGAPAGPAPGCEAAPRQADAVTSSDDAFVNLASGDLALSGTARAGTTGVTGSLTDSDGQKVDFTAELSAGDGPKTWTATITREELETLADGNLVASARYENLNATLDGATLTIAKDVVAPRAPSSTPVSGTYTSAQSVHLTHDDADAGTRIHYTANGSVPTAASLRASGPFWVTSTQVIKALAIDSAGNKSDVATLEYRIEAPVATAEQVQTALPTPVPTAIMQPAPQVEVAPLKVSGLRLTSSKSARNIRRHGLTVRFNAPANARKVRVNLMRGATRIASRTMATPTGGAYTVVLSARSLKRLAAGTYRLEVTPVTDRAVSTTKLNVRIGR